MRNRKIKRRYERKKIKRRKNKKKPTFGSQNMD